MKQEHIDEIKGVLIFAAGLILLASLISFVPDDLSWYTSNPNVPAKNLVRIVGAYLAGSVLFVFGHSAYCLAGFLLFWSWNKFAGRQLEFTFSKLVSALILFCSVSTLFGMTGSQIEAFRFARGGLVGFLSADFLVKYLGWTGAYIVLFTLGTLTLIITGEFLVSPFLMKLLEVCRDVLASFKNPIKNIKQTMVPAKTAVKKQPPKARLRHSDPEEDEDDYESEIDDEEEEEDDEEEDSYEEDADADVEEGEGEEEPLSVKPTIRIANPVTDKAKEMKPKIVGEYHLPGLDLLEDPPEISESALQSDLENGAQILETTLKDFNVKVRVADIERGPVITRYELEPAPGVKVQQITTLSDDIALAMRAAAVRIVAPIPGKNRVGIEVPNSSKAAVYLKDVLATSQFQNAKSKLTLALGKDISGRPLIADLADMPHLLIAGTTGAGKTVCVNTIIMSMLYNSSPEDLKFLMVDPKMVELACYNDLPHMLSPAVTDAKKVSAALNWIVAEMEHRYKLLSKERVRNIKGYRERGLPMPYIVVIIDELADLMQVSAKTIESSITRLAQLSRAVGIHLILATQRPSVDVITGVIKANFPARVSFKVASKVDSRTVLDMNGAETLLGKGDLLFIQPGDAKPTRGQCSFVSDKEVFRVIDFIKNQQTPEYDDTILNQQTSGAGGGSEQQDELYDEAVRVVIETNQASVSILQRRMRLGYTRAARLIDMMEQNGIVGPYCGSKARELLVDREEWLVKNMNNSPAEET
ncbi:MAG TPA: DNA translocase FtsK [Candidatus Omnitrophota bacterium]|nr:DNA translocase FtsK [Candidatus Omnitrophota bacterium]